ncbi:hypothetical protein BGZ76_006026 [Entomortierella beljakovae]|nr:hypothetical protein BGZ76_006026 [Entomortierella beljakovae]
MLIFNSRSGHAPVLAFLGSAILSATLISAAPDPIIEGCLTTGCNTVRTILGPCGGGAGDTSLQQNAVYTVTPFLGSCECNSQFFNAFHDCLACVASQAKSSPSIDNQQNWVEQCDNYGFNFTDAPIPFILPKAGDTSNTAHLPSVGGASPGSGLAAGAIIGIVIGVIVVFGLVGYFIFRSRKRRTKNDIFAKPYTLANNTDAEDSASTRPAFTTFNNYQNAGYPTSSIGYSDQDQVSQYDYSQNQDQFNTYSSNQNDETDAMMMKNLRHSNYIPPPIPMSPSAVDAVNNFGNLGSPRPGDAYPQNLPKNKDWEGRQYEFTSDLISTDQLLHNDKQAFNEEEDLALPRSNRFENDRDDLVGRRSLTPPRATMSSYRDEFARPSYEYEPRRNSGERGSVSGMNIIRSGYDSNDEERNSNSESPESRRRRGGDLFAS